MNYLILVQAMVKYKWLKKPECLVNKLYSIKALPTERNFHLSGVHTAYKFFALFCSANTKFLVFC